jgi:translation elongation factor EF-Tu-like GTPase
MYNFISIKANIFLFQSDKGGRVNPICSGYHPNLVFGFEGTVNELQKEGKYTFTQDTNTGKINNTDGLFLFENEEMPLGKNFEVTIVIGDWSEHFVKSQERFLVREGSKIVGYGEVI